MRKFAILIGFSLLAILLQLTVGSWLTIQDINPDFILILVLFIGALYGRLFGELYGFSIGLIVDLIGIGSFLGLSALSKTIAGFLAGYFKGRRSRFNSFTFYSFACLIILVHYSIFYFINFHSAGYPVQFLLLRYIIPETVYTSIIYIVLDYILSLDNV